MKAKSKKKQAWVNFGPVPFPREEFLEHDICPECGYKLPEPKLENREGGYSELVTYCPCGANYTGGM